MGLYASLNSSSLLLISIAGKDFTSHGIIFLSLSLLLLGLSLVFIFGSEIISTAQHYFLFHLFHFLIEIWQRFFVSAGIGFLFHLHSSCLYLCWTVYPKVA